MAVWDSCAASLTTALAGVGTIVQLCTVEIKVNTDLKHSFHKKYRVWEEADPQTRIKQRVHPVAPSMSSIIAATYHHLP